MTYSKPKEKSKTWCFMLFHKKGEPMIQNRLKALLLSAGLITSPLSIMAFDWVPVGDCVQEVNGVNYAYDNSTISGPCDSYDSGDRIVVSLLSRDLKADKAKAKAKTKAVPKKSDVTRSGLNNTNFTATVDDHILNIYGQLNQNGDACPLKIDGDIELVADTVDMRVNIQTPVVIMPYIDPTGDEFGAGGDFSGTGHSQLYFNPSAGRTITVHVQHNLEFIGRTLGPVTMRKGALESAHEKSVKRDVTRAGEGEDACSLIQPLDMFITFAGTGQTVFHLDDGTTIKFLGDIDTCNPVSTCDNNSFLGISNNAGGTKVFVTMEQTQDSVNCFFDKVVFQRTDLGSNNPCTNDSRVGIVIGNNSIFSYVSTDVTGIAHEGDSGLGNFASVAFDPSNNGQGRMILYILGAYTFGFDTGTFTTADPGYLAIHQKYPFNEGSLIVAGHSVDSFSPSDIRTTLNYSEPAGGQAIMRVTDDLFYANRRSGPYDPNKRRGLLVINDCQSVTKRAADPYLDFLNAPTLMSRVAKKEAPTQVAKGKRSPTRATTVGACTFPDTTFNCFASEVGGAAQTFGYDWSYSKGLNSDNYLRNVRNGFVVGINGALDINHNTFLDYVAGSINQADLLAVNDYTNNTVRADQVIKAKNPAAMIIDGLDTTLFTQGLSQFEAANPLLRDRPINARINLRGDGTLLLRAAGSTKLGYIYNLWSSLIPPVLSRSMSSAEKTATFRKPNLTVDTPMRLFGEEGECATGDNPIDQPDFNYTEGLLVGSGTFDGYNLSAPIDANQPGITEKCSDGTVGVILSGEGQHVIEFEGKATIWSYPNTSILSHDEECSSRVYADDVEQAGVVNMSSIVIDYTGNEFDTRPLVIGDTYDRYNSPAMFLNDNVHFVNTNLVHSDVTKLVNGNPAQSEPAIVGGERNYFASRFFSFDTGGDNSLTDRDRWRLPELQLYSSTLHLFESLNSTGIRWVVKDVPTLLADGLFTQVDGDTPDVGLSAGSNTSSVTFYDHGNVNDTNFTGHGRILQQGSLHNTMADGHTTTWTTEDSYWNVFKSNQPPLLTRSDSEIASTVLLLQNGNQFPSNIAPSGLPVDDQYNGQRAHHLFLNSVMQQGGTNVALGWPVENAQFARTRSINNAYPYMNTVYPLNYAAVESISTNSADLFNLDAFLTPPATVLIDANYICWGGFNVDGKSVLTPINRGNNQGVMYVNHGGEITITRPDDMNLQSQPYITVIDTIFGQQISNDYNLVGDTRDQQLTGIIDLPHDQTIFAKGAGIQTYGFTQAMFDERSDVTAGYVRLSFDNPSRSTADRSGANSAIINWFNREGDNAVFQPFPTRSAANLMGNFGKHKTRAIETVKTPVLKPANLLYVGTNDDIRQFKIAGATLSDPLVLEVSGDISLPIPGRVREFITLPRSQDLPGGDHMIGEGDHARLYLDFGGRIGLGSTQFNEESSNAWTRLGKDYVQILPLGDGVIDVNSNLLIADRLALVATTSFSQDSIVEEDVVHNPHRLTFYSSQPREIRIPAGGELDLSSFGQAPSIQQICFGGKITLVFEEGSTLRFPSAGDAKVRDINGNFVFAEDDTIDAPPVVIYLNDEAQLIFEGQIEPQTVTQPFTLSSNADQQRVKILGKGQIWLDKNAKLSVLRTGSVGVETDSQTPQTDIVISLHRQAQFNIGNEILQGGSFQVGNISEQGEGSFINFKLQHLFGGNPRTHIDREGFFGIGAGIIDKHGLVNGDATRAGNPVMNGSVAALDGDNFPVFTPSTDPTNGWTVQALFDVNNVVIDLQSGRLEHNNIANGSSVAASLFAVGPASSYYLGLNGPTNVQVVGGGNMMKVPAGINGLFVNVWDYASVLPDGEQYSILPSAPLIFRRTDAPSYQLHNDPDNGIVSGVQFSVNTLDAFFDLLSFKPIGTQTQMLADVGTGNFVYTAGFVNANNNPADIYPTSTLKIVRKDTPVLLPQGNIAVGLITGTLTANGLDKPRDPLSFALYLTN